MTEYVAGFAFDSKCENVALVRKLKPAWQAGKLNGIGGKVELGEVPIDAMVREFKEETGVASTPNDWMPLGQLSGSWGIVYFYRSSSIDISQCRTVEAEEIVVIPTRSLYDNQIIPNLHWLVPMAVCLETQLITHEVGYFISEMDKEAHDRGIYDISRRSGTTSC